MSEPSESRPLAGRTALITGASRGIGAAVAQRLALAGAHVLLLARTQGGLEEVDDAIRQAGGTASLIVQDLRDHDHIDDLGPPILERYGKLDIFVGNAAILGALSPLGHYKPQTWAEVFDVVLHANWRLIRILDPLLRLSDSGRAIFVTANVASTPRAYWGPYAAANAALENMARTWALENAKTSLNVNMVDPGPVATQLCSQAYPGEDASTLRQPGEITGEFVNLASPACTLNGACIVLPASTAGAAGTTGTRH
ncbi:MAG: SDR family NAD(P)-dependent oxidoreductase [Alphaproteobacteria bacterium]